MKDMEKRYLTQKEAEYYTGMGGDYSFPYHEGSGNS